MAANNIKSFRKTVLHLGLLFIVSLALLSVYGAFIGADNSQRFFSSMPMGFFWGVFALLMIWTMAIFKQLWRKSDLALIHVGCILVIGGSMLASEAGHKLQKSLFGKEKLRRGMMQVFNDQDAEVIYYTDKDVGTNKPGIFKPDFSIRLNEFRIHYYEPGDLFVFTGDGKSWQLPAEVSKTYDLGGDVGKVTVLRSFKNFRINIDDGKREITDSAGFAMNPAIEVEFEKPDGTKSTRYVFQKHSGHKPIKGEPIFKYSRDIKDYISDVEVIRNGKVVASKSIEVNKPLHWGGYYIYQHNYDKQAGRFTILSVSSDSGIVIIYAGYAALCLGVLWRLWFRKRFTMERVIAARTHINDNGKL